MAASMLTRFGNDLYTGERSVDFVGKRKIWLTIAVALMTIAVLVPFVRGAGDYVAGFNFGIEFRGGSQFQVLGVSDTAPTIAEDAIHEIVPDTVVRVTTVGGDGLRIQTEQVTNDETQEIAAALEVAYDTDSITSSFVGATWGADIRPTATVGDPLPHTHLPGRAGSARNPVWGSSEIENFEFIQSHTALGHSPVP